MSEAVAAASAFEPTPHEIWTRLARAPALAVLVDLDGTLLPFAPTVEEAALDDAAAAVLRRLGTSDSSSPVPPPSRSNTTASTPWSARCSTCSPTPAS